VAELSDAPWSTSPLPLASPNAPCIPGLSLVLRYGRCPRRPIAVELSRLSQILLDWPGDAAPSSFSEPGMFPPTRPACGIDLSYPGRSFNLGSASGAIACASPAPQEGRMFRAERYCFIYRTRQNKVPDSLVPFGFRGKALKPRGRVLNEEDSSDDIVLALSRVRTPYRSHHR
jgi:hypothetical protein